MAPALRSLGYAVAARATFPHVLHRTVFPNQLTILMYHAIVKAPLAVPHWCFLDEPAFRQQIKYIKAQFEVVRLREAVERMAEGRIRRPTAVITFDDGFQNNYDVAFPILCDEGLPATIFLTTGFVDGQETLWFCRLHDALTRTKRTSLEWRGRRFTFTDRASTARTSAELQHLLKTRGHSELLIEVDRILRTLGITAEGRVTTDSPYRMLSRKAVLKMSASGLIDFGAHTCSHAILTGLSPDQRRAEITESLAAVARLTGEDCPLFSYPNGSTADYDATATDILRRCGVYAAVTTNEGPNDANTPRLELRRYGIGAELNFARFQLLAHHMLARFRSRV